MLKFGDRLVIHLLHRMGNSMRSISRITRHDRKSVRNVLREPAPQPREDSISGKFSDTRGRPRKLEPFEPFLRGEISAKPVHPPQLLSELRKRGYTGSLKAVRRFLRAHRAKIINGKQQMQNWMRMVLQDAIAHSRIKLELGHRISNDDLETLLDCVRTRPLKLRNRALCVLAHLKGVSRREVAAFLCLDRKTVKNCLAAFTAGGVQRLLDLSRKELKKANDPEYIDAVFRVFHTPPSACGFNRTAWRMCDLQTALLTDGVKIARVNIRAIIKNAGYKYRKARKVLTSTDPDYRKKLERITQILSNLQPDEKFFSIDEFGPFAVKMQGGLGLSKPGQTRTIPQHQKSRGTLIVTAALELSTNQVTHFYSAKKNTDEMIRMLDTLLKHYRRERQIYFSWDAASWHGSKRFFKRVKEANAPDHRAPNGTPEIVLAPLPASAQFLNVIESVFSGMARAIIHNSDYQSAERCKQAIDRYFAERNEHLQKHPQKAGKKIWGKERVVAEFTLSNNCKDPRW